jgi:hypothetical protein
VNLLGEENKMGDVSDVETASNKSFKSGKSQHASSNQLAVESPMDKHSDDSQHSL